MTDAKTLALRGTINTRAEHLFGIAEQNLNKTITRPYINFRLRGVCSARSIYHYEGDHVGEIRFNEEALLGDVDAPNDGFINDIVAHEVAHIVAYYHFDGCTAHKDGWRIVMKWFAA